MLNGYSKSYPKVSVQKRCFSRYQNLRFLVSERNVFLYRYFLFVFRRFLSVFKEKKYLKKQFFHMDTCGYFLLHRYSQCVLRIVHLERFTISLKNWFFTSNPVFNVEFSEKGRIINAVYRIQGENMDNITLKALAKINLGLDVVRRREDGYHEVRMVMQTIHLYDKLDIAKKKEQGISITSNLSYVPTNENNLVYKAGKLLMEEFDIKEGVSVHLQKRIPVAAGMAGGSTDAAAMLYGMNEMFGLGLSRQQLMERGVKIGADVPYCLMRGTALAEGIGEKLTSLPPMVKCPVLIAKPQISVSTKFVYQNLKLDENTVHPDIDQLITDIRKQDLHAIAGDMGNVLESVTIPEYPIITKIKEQMLKSGAVNAMMSGSGPTVFGLFEDEATARKAYDDMVRSGLAKQIYVTSIYNNRRK